MEQHSGWGWWRPPPWGWLAPEDIWAELRPSGHHYEVRLGLGIILMYNMSILEAFWGGDGGYLDLDVGAGAGIRVGQAEVGPPP